MTNRNLNQHGAQMTGMCVMIGRCSLDSQHRALVRSPANVCCSFSRYANNSSFRYTNDEQINHSHQRTQRRKWTNEDNKLALYCILQATLQKEGIEKE